MNTRRTPLLACFVTAAVFGGLGLVNVISPVVLGAGVLVCAAIGGLIVWQSQEKSALTLEERVQEARNLRVTRERERAFYEMTNTLSGTLDYQKVLDAVQNIGELVTRHQGANTPLVSAALLFQGNRAQLHVASSRGLTRNDMKVVVPGKEGVLGLALKQADPVYASLASRDPELQYFVGFQDCKSIMALPLRAGFDYYGVLVFGSPQPDAFSEDYVELLKAISTQATFALQNSVLYQTILQEKERIVEVEEDARKKLSRDLHDGPTQSIAAIAMRINYVSRLIDKTNTQVHEELAKIEDLARRTTKEIRHMLFTLRPLILESQGLVAALNQLSEKMRDTHNQNVIVEAQPGIERWLDNHAQGVVFYIVDEAVNNARKHAQAAHIWVRLYQHEGYFIIEIEDDGVGFDQAAMEKEYLSRASASLGMVNMRERAEMIEGRLHLVSQEGKGTKVSVLVPLKPSAISATQRPDAVRSPQSTMTQLARLQSAAPADPPSTPTKPKPVIPHATKRSPSS